MAYVRVTSYRPPPPPLGYCPACTSPVTPSALRPVGFVCGHCGTVAPLHRLHSQPMAPGPPPPPPPPQPPDPERQEWSDLLAHWLVVYDRCKPWRLRRRVQAWRRLRHWQTVLGVQARRGGPYQDIIVTVTIVMALATAAWCVL